MEHCKKLSSWDIYDVRKFPYRGNRKYTPDIHQSFYGIITITNDVFGLTILQFEREFQACLARRKTYEQSILNIRFPDKTTKEYIEYLKYEDKTLEGCCPTIEHQCTGTNLSDEDRMYRDLIRVAGTELEIRTRQRMFNVKDKIQNRTTDDLFRGISSGSQAEGIILHGSDIDIMYELPGVTVIDDVKYAYKSIGQTILLMEQDARYPGFCKLKLLAEGRHVSECISNSLKETNYGVYISTETAIHWFDKTTTCGYCEFHSRHGPCMSDFKQSTDHALCLRSKLWPKDAMNWTLRHRAGQWPTGQLIDTVVNDGCLFVAIGPKSECNELLWRISFSLAEKRLSHSMNYTQLLCYVLLKLSLKNIINRNEYVKDLLCSYFLKTTVFWLSEEICIDIFKMTNLSYCFSRCIDKLISFVRNCYCPNYFIPRHNMFIGKVNEFNNELLLYILVELRNTELKLIIDEISGNNFSNHCLCIMTDKNKLSVNADFDFYAIANVGTAITLKNVYNGYETLQYIKISMESASSEFVLDVLRYYHARINQQISQMLVLTERRHTCSCCRNDNIIRRCYKHLMDGTKSDAVTGWVLYASFCYVLGEYKKTLQIIDNVLSRCTPDMICIGNTYTTEQMNTYQQKTESYLTLNHRMRQATLDCVHYIKQSTLIPPELQLEVEDAPKEVQPVVMCKCLQFLSYHRLGDVNKKQRALRKLYLTIQNGHSSMSLSTSLVILGVCHELSEDKDSAYHCYSDALQCEQSICLPAERRI